MRINAVFQGGGVRAIAHAGALYEMEQRADVTIAKIGGTSAGAIVAALYAAGYTASDLKEIIPDLLATGMPERLRPWTKAWRIYRHFGVHSTNKVCTRIRELLHRKGKRRFSELDIPCRIVAADITNRSSEVFGAKDDVDPVEAVRMSISIPFFFQPYLRGDRMYVDGGLVSNYPLWIFKDDELPTVGFRLENRIEENRRDIANVFQFLNGVIATACEAGDRDGRAFPRDYTTISIDTEGIRATDFELHERDVNLLHARGRLAVNDVQWDALPKRVSLSFVDPKADQVLERTVRELHEVLTRTRYSRGKEFRKYDVTYHVLSDGSAAIHRDFELVAKGAHPLSCMTLSAHSAPHPSRMSFHDLQVEAYDLTGDDCDVSVVPALNTPEKKHIGLFFLPAVLPGETRKVRVKQLYPGCFQRLLAYQPDEIGLRLEEPVESCTIRLEHDRSLKIDFSEPLDQSARFVRKKPVRYSEDRVIHEWVAHVSPPPPAFRFKVELRRAENRAAS